MLKASKEMDFMKAASLRDEMFGLEKVVGRQITMKIATNKLSDLFEFYKT
jgi:excinuclease UvrABC nuclease subunit